MSGIGTGAAAYNVANRKLSSDVQRKLSAISNCSDVSNLSFKLGMDPNDFKSTIQNILDLDVGDGWSVHGDSDEDELSCYGDESQMNRFQDVDAATDEQHRTELQLQPKRKISEVVTINVDRKTSTGSQVSTADSVEGADDDFVPVNIEVETVKKVISMYQKQRNRKISSSTAAVATLPVTKE